MKFLQTNYMEWGGFSLEKIILISQDNNEIIFERLDLTDKILMNFILNSVIRILSVQSCQVQKKTKQKRGKGNPKKWSLKNGR